MRLLRIIATTNLAIIFVRASAAKALDLLQAGQPELVGFFGEVYEDPVGFTISII